MKKILCTVLLAVPMTVILQGQDTISIRHSIFSKMKTVPSSVSSRGQIYFELNDVNPYIYTGKIREIQRDIISNEDLVSKDYTSESLQKFEFTTITLPEFVLPTVASPERVTAMNNERRSLRQMNDSLNSLTDRFTAKIMLRNQLFAKDSLKIVTSAADSATKGAQLIALRIAKYESPAITENLNDLQRNTIEIETLRRKIRQVLQTIADAESRIEDLRMQDMAYYDASLFVEDVQAYVHIVAQINKCKDAYNELLLLVHSYYPFSIISKEKERIMLSYFGDANAAPIQYTGNLFEELNRLYYELTRIYNQLQNRTPVEEAYKKLAAYHASLDASSISDLCKSITKLSNSISPENWKVTYQTTAISSRADQIGYSIEFTNKTSELIQFNRPLKFDYTFDIVGGTKIDVSAGLLFHINLQDQKYTLTPVSDSTTLLRLEDGGRVTPTVGALLNIYKRSNSTAKMALNIGTGTDTKRVYYYLGGSLIIGREERAGIGGGLVGGYVKRLSGYYDVPENSNEKILNKPVDQLLPDVVTTDAFRVGYYFTITYNLSSKNKQAFEQGFKK
jgi:hypothetical protein